MTPAEFQVIRILTKGSRYPLPQTAPYDSIIEWFQAIHREEVRRSLTYALSADDPRNMTIGYVVGPHWFQIPLNTLRLRAGWPLGMSEGQSNALIDCFRTAMGRAQLGHNPDIIANIVRNHEAVYERIGMQRA